MSLTPHQRLARDVAEEVAHGPEETESGLGRSTPWLQGYAQGVQNGHWPGGCGGHVGCTIGTESDEYSKADQGEADVGADKAIACPAMDSGFRGAEMEAGQRGRVMNLLFRFGETHNLTFALPARGASQLGYPHYFRAEFVEGFGAPGHAPHFDIMCHHLRFLRAQVQRVMPNSTFYFSILRNPVHLMESSFSYYKDTSPFARARSLEEFLSQPERFYRPLEPDSHYAKNLMAFDFGFNHNGAVSAQHSQQMLRHLEQAFDLLLLSEYFDESMVLLKEALCWDLDSVVAFPLNSREGGTRSPLSESTAEKIKSWNSLDWAIYSHVNRTFWQRVEGGLGRERMQREVRALRARRAQLAKACLQGGGSVPPRELRDKSLAPLQYGLATILGYNLKPGLDQATGQLCRRMVTPELQYSRSLYRRQFPEKAQQTYRPTPPPA
ncbi:galactose-3-O-sulfotransferase 2-like [Pelodiscus sinensis]|uniref:galactose-3-O-sulfotransferase 2-like n=1 Tax=Pelodiscus sinensis TaxID=13735 RepID=UPI003F6D93D3